MRRDIRILGAVLALLSVGAGPADDGRWHAGSYSFSDELGGFRIRSVSGTGTRTDPIEITEEFSSASPVTLIIRPSRPPKPKAPPEGAVHLRIVALNASGVGWIEFEFELQEVRGKPSDFYDGLSFDQANPNPGFIASDRFAAFENQFESYDRLRFTDGHVDALDQASFRFFITDVTPVDEFYLVQDPRIPSI